MTKQEYPYLGYGLGLRHQHLDDILRTKPAIDWFEIISEDYLVPGGNKHHYLEKIREFYPIVMHGVSLSIGSSDPLDWDYLRQLKQLAEQFQPMWVSDHLCWVGVNGYYVHDLLPLPYTEETIQHVVEKISQVQDYLGRQILLENVSSYITYKTSELTEWEFLRTIAEQADCYILLDINNIYVSGYNHHFDPETYLNAIPKERVKQFHLAGHTYFQDGKNGRGDPVALIRQSADEKGVPSKNYIVDTHDHDVIDPVWQLFCQALRRFGRVSTMIERDAHIPPLADLMAELAIARRYGESVQYETMNLQKQQSFHVWPQKSQPENRQNEFASADSRTTTV